MRSAEMSAASRVFSGASTTISASQLSRTWTSIGAGTARRSSDAWRSHVRGAKLPPRATRSERVRIALGDELHDLLQERAPRHRPHDEHLPAGLHADARVDEELGELTISGIRHGGEYKTYVLFCKVRLCRS